ncbi:hypothetical protein FRB94_001059 [Tulasnella sp. JGI-2019a]|nr:hypothetical protein FRB94_001059 [Tulasnella sp. JGI-2019a]
MLVTTDRDFGSRLREPARSLLENLLTQEPALDVAVDAATAIALTPHTEASFPELRQQAIAVLEKAMVAALAATSPSLSNLF